MKNIFLLVSLMLISIVNIIAQDNRVNGSWLITKVNIENQDQEVYFPLDFSEDGQLGINGQAFGSWKYDQKNQKINISSKDFEELDGESDVLKLNNEELILGKEGTKVFFIKIDKDMIYRENENSGLFGVWEMEDEANPEVTKLITFEAPDNSKLIIKQEGMEERQSCPWIFNETNLTLLLLGRIENLGGLNIVLKLDKDILELENNGTVYTLKRKDLSNHKIERLTFNENEFYDEEGNWKYEDAEELLPWQDFYNMTTSLENVHQLVYNYSKLIEDTEVFESKTLTANVQVNMEEENLSIDYIFYGYDNYDLPEDTQLPTTIYNPSAYPSALYPLKDDMPYRVVENEEITTPAGTFYCIVIEGISDFDVKMKMWMIKDKPGIYARIIEDRPGSFGHYLMYELQEIK
jgi:hypothetical protein